jgi:hypothetical protein
LRAPRPRRPRLRKIMWDCLSTELSDEGPCLPKARVHGTGRQPRFRPWQFATIDDPRLAHRRRHHGLGDAVIAPLRPRPRPSRWAGVGALGLRALRHLAFSFLRAWLQACSAGMPGHAPPLGGCMCREQALAFKLNHSVPVCVLRRWFTGRPPAIRWHAPLTQARRALARKPRLRRDRSKKTGWYAGAKLPLPARNSYQLASLEIDLRRLGASEPGQFRK